MKTVIKIYNLFVTILFTVSVIIGLIYIFPFMMKIKAYHMEGISMEPTLHDGDIAFVDTKDTALEVDDIAVYVNDDGKRILHRVIHKYEDGYLFKGDYNPVSDGVTTTQAQIIGKYKFTVPKKYYLLNHVTRTQIFAFSGLLAVLIIIKHIIYLTTEAKNSDI